MEAWRSSDEGPCNERLDESFVPTVDESEEWEDSGGWVLMGGSRAGLYRWRSSLGKTAIIGGLTHRGS